MSGWQCCPICAGRGTVHAGFYTGGMSTNTQPVKCRSCGGRGVLLVPGTPPLSFFPPTQGAPA